MLKLNHINVVLSSSTANLNTSHVKVKHIMLKENLKYHFNLNTSHVKVKLQFIKMEITI